MTDWIIPLLCGLGAGILSAWGVGGGTLLLLVMTLVLDVDQRTAQGINLLFFLPTAASALWCHARNGCLDKPVLRRTVPPALAAALVNDTDASLIYAQQLLGLGRPGDVLLCISTSGNARNCCLAAQTARALGVEVIALTGAGGGRLAELSDCLIAVPERETYLVQQMHLPLYHALCARLEARFFGGEA